MLHVSLMHINNICFCEELRKYHTLGSGERALKMAYLGLWLSNSMLQLNRLYILPVYDKPVFNALHAG